MVMEIEVDLPAGRVGDDVVAASETAGVIARPLVDYEADRTQSLSMAPDVRSRSRRRIVRAILIGSRPIARERLAGCPDRLCRRPARKGWRYRAAESAGYGSSDAFALAGTTPAALARSAIARSKGRGRRRGLEGSPTTASAGIGAAAAGMVEQCTRPARPNRCGSRGRHSLLPVI